MPRPILATIHPGALRRNLARARRAAGDARVWAVVKADAYGHGIERVFDALRGADGFALLDLAEAARLRALGWRGPVLLLEGAFEARDLELCSRLGLWHVVHCDAQIDMLAAHKTQAGHRVFLKLDSGMHRLGFAPHRLGAAWTRLNALPQVEEISLMTHFANADVDMDADADGGGPAAAAPARAGLDAQLRCFQRAAGDLPGERSLANSAALLRHGHRPEVRADWVRPGIALYGSAPDFPDRDAAHWGLQPAMTLATRIIGVQEIGAGDAVGYGSTFVADRPMRVGTAACGYADGYPRHAGTGTPVLVGGRPSRLLGRVSMDMLAVDLTGLPEAGIGSPVTLWGRDAGSGAALPIDAVARAAGTLAYELMCALAPRVPVVVEEDEAEDGADA